MLVETFERGDSISRYVAQGPGALHNDELARLGSYALLQVPALKYLMLHLTTRNSCAALTTSAGNLWLTRIIYCRNTLLNA